TEPKPVVEIPITQRPDSILSAEEKKIKYAKLYLDSVGTARLDQATALPAVEGTTAKFVIKPDLHRINIHAPEYQHRPDSSEMRLQAISLLKQIQHKRGNADTVSKIVPGKITASLQVYRFMKKHPSRILLGDGLGNFSSKMAFRATGLKIAGGYPARYAYTNDDFEKNHLSVYLTHFGKDSVYHSIANSPNSFYLQVLSEYGLLGLFFFVSGYLGFFMRSVRKLSYGLPVLLIMLCAFVVEYWFEQLSIVVMFELMLLSDLKSAGEGRSL
ncbi:MAG: hypothetical protein JWQ78_783, partial [Sediminibacterium sp.]|nr:hypothetical protein [Sediminibacterium sp.]